MDWMGLEERIWTGCGLDPKGQCVRARFRGTLSMEQVPSRATISLASLNRYRLVVNGEIVMHGPARAPQREAYMDSMDITDCLHPGTNILEVDVEAYPAWPRKDLPGGCAGPMMHYPSPAGPMLSVTSRTFPEMESCAFWSVIPDLTVELNGRDGLLAGPTETVRMDRSRQEAFPAVRIGQAGSNPWGELDLPEILPRPVPDLLRQDASFCEGSPSLRVEAFKKGTLRLHTNALVTAIPRLRLYGGRGARVEVVYAESVLSEQDGHLVKAVRDEAKGCVEGLTDTIFPAGLQAVWEPLWFRAFRFVEIRVEAGGEEVCVQPLGCTVVRYPLQVLSRIRSPEAWIGDIYDMSLRTLQNCMHDSYEDCPYYEQLQYIMDTRLEALYTHRVSGDTRLSRHAICLYAASRMPSGLLQSRYPCARLQVIPGFSLCFIEMLMDDYLQTGDLAFLRSQLPIAYGIVQAFEAKITDHGMVGALGWWEYADWTDAWGGSEGVPTAVVHGEESALHNLHFVYVLRLMVRLLLKLGEAENAARMEALADRVSDSVRKNCYDPQRGMFREGRCTREFSQHSQVWAVLGGVSKGEEARRILTHALEEKDVIPCSFCMQFYLFRALEEAGMYERTLPLWDAWKSLLPLHLSTIPETPTWPRSDCHAWGALALYEFTAKWLGVDMGEPGWATVRICPRPDLICNLAGTVTTPRGPVYVSWMRKDIHRIHLWIQAPPEAACEARLPDGKALVLEKGSFDGEVDMDLMRFSV